MEERFRQKQSTAIWDHGQFSSNLETELLLVASMSIRCPGTRRGKMMLMTWIHLRGAGSSILRCVHGYKETGNCDVANGEMIITEKTHKKMFGDGI